MKGNKRRIDKLDSLFLWVSSLSSLGFTIFVAYLNMPLIPYLPIFALIAYSVVIGYISGAIFLDSFTERIRGWNYLLLGLAFYTPPTMIKFSESYIQTLFPNFPRISVYLQLFLGFVVPFCYYLVSTKFAIPRIYESFRIPRMNVTNLISRKSFLTSVYLGSIFYISVLLATYYPKTDFLSKLVYVLFILMFSIPLVSEEKKTRDLLWLEKYQHFIKHESITIHKRLPKVTQGLIVLGIIAFIVQFEFPTYFPLSLWTFSLWIIFFILAVYSPIVVLSLLLNIKTRRDRFTLNDRAEKELSENEFQELKNLVSKLNDC